MAVETEMSVKHQRICEFLSRGNLDGVLLTERANFSWITGGRCNRIANNATQGVASVLATPEKLLCLANDIEAPRMKREEFAHTGIETISFPWWDGAAAQKTAAQVIGGRRVAVDSEDFGLNLPRLGSDFNRLRWSLTQEEIARYRQGGRQASLAMEEACRSIKPGDSEHEAAGLLDHALHAAGLNPLVTLVASDQRIADFRHPIPTAKPIARHVMLVTCADFGGLISCLTRFVSFGPLSQEIKTRHQAVCEVDAAVINATRPGRMLCDIFSDLLKAYERAGHPDQWRLHHQGGSTGYANRDLLATPTCRETVCENQAFAWNPSITGVKSEDTIFATAGGMEVLTPSSPQWPTVRVGDFARPDILVR